MEHVHNYGDLKTQKEIEFLKAENEKLKADNDFLKIMLDIPVEEVDYE